jgi:hypothetical protein
MNHKLIIMISLIISLVATPITAIDAYNECWYGEGHLPDSTMDLVSCGIFSASPLAAYGGGKAMDLANVKSFMKTAKTSSKADIATKFILTLGNRPGQIVNSKSSSPKISGNASKTWG